MNIENTLAERAKTHGKFENHAIISQALKDVIHLTEGFTTLTPSQAESLEMIMHKVARILNGNANTFDHWHDIAGYATLIAKELECDK